MVARSVTLRLFLAIGIVGAIHLTAQARVQLEFAYPFAQIWSSAIRMLRVDLGCTITDRDEEGGFVLFEYPDGRGMASGSIEFIRRTTTQGERVSVSVQVPSLPSYIGQMFLDRLGRKLYEDYGQEPTPRPPPAPPPDAGADGRAPETNETTDRSNAR